MMPNTVTPNRNGKNQIYLNILYLLYMLKEVFCVRSLKEYYERVWEKSSNTYKERYEVEFCDAKHVS